MRPIFTLVLLLLTARPANATWTSDTSVNTAVATGTERAFDPILVPDGTGGTFVVFPTDVQSPVMEGRVRVQRLDSTGAPAFPGDGIDLTTAIGPTANLNVVATSDGSGGVVVVYQAVLGDPAEVNLLAQRIGPDGSLLWSGQNRIADPVRAGRVHDVRRVGERLVIVSSTTNVYLHVLGLDGAPTPEVPSGLIVGSADEFFTNPDVFAFDDREVVIVWNDDSSPLDDDYVLRLQRLDVVDGLALEAAGGVVLETRTASASPPKIVPNAENDRVVVVWSAQTPDGDESEPASLWAQVFTKNGLPIWNPLAQLSDPVTGPSGPGQSVPGPYAVVDIGTAGTMVVFPVNGSDPENVRVQVVDAIGSVQFGARGIALDPGDARAPATDTNNAVHAVRFGPEAVIVAYERRILPTTDYNVRAQKIGFDGSLPWGSEGILLRTAPGTHIRPGLALLSDTLAVAAFSASGSQPVVGADFDSYAQVFQTDGTLGAPVVTSVPSSTSGTMRLSSAPNPSQGSTSVRFDAARAGRALIEVFDVRGRLVQRRTIDVPSGASSVPLTLRADDGRRLASGSYLLRVQMNGNVAARKIALVE